MNSRNSCNKFDICSRDSALTTPCLNSLREQNLDAELSSDRWMKVDKPNTIKFNRIQFCRFFFSGFPRIIDPGMEDSSISLLINLQKYVHQILIFQGKIYFSSFIVSFHPHISSQCFITPLFFSIIDAHLSDLHLDDYDSAPSLYFFSF